MYIDPELAIFKGKMYYENKTVSTLVNQLRDGLFGLCKFDHWKVYILHSHQGCLDDHLYGTMALGKTFQEARNLAKERFDSLAERKLRSRRAVKIKEIHVIGYIDDLERSWMDGEWWRFTRPVPHWGRGKTEKLSNAHKDYELAADLALDSFLLGMEETYRDQIDKILNNAFVWRDRRAIIKKQFWDAKQQQLKSEENA
jgi:hypothetical protein